MEPRWVGRGHGSHFGSAVLSQIHREQPSTPVRVAIQQWNTRSRKLVRRLGFVEREQHKCVQNGRLVTYVVAILSLT
ncbi:hypothetical protein [Nocardia sp. NBC_01499]|uniref:hypothetical protein n=1 Tax=Nocardia sp. NBC_01499 TaxID=2903597 RepID=UPI0038692299